MNQNYKYINVEFKNITNNDIIDFNFIPYLKNQITHRWLELVEMATQLYPIDEPDRFYDFNSHNKEVEIALNKINRDIEIINSHKRIINRDLTSVYDQDTLNYLHHIFEVYHGLLNKQATDYWNNAPDTVRNALANLNIDVHRCETVQDKNLEPRFVTTWYGMPKTHYIFDDDYRLFTNKYEFGTMYLTYAEIGKTLEHLCKDKELSEHSYAHAEAFKPYDFLSADLHVRFHNRNDATVSNDNIFLSKCYDKHKDFFKSKGFNKNDTRLLPGALPVAKIKTNLSNTEVIDTLSTHQYVNKVSVIRN